MKDYKLYTIVVSILHIVVLASVPIQPSGLDLSIRWIWFIIFTVLLVGGTLVYLFIPFDKGPIRVFFLFEYAAAFLFYFLVLIPTLVRITNVERFSEFALIFVYVSIPLFPMGFYAFINEEWVTKT